MFNSGRPVDDALCLCYIGYGANIARNEMSFEEVVGVMLRLNDTDYAPYVASGYALEICGYERPQDFENDVKSYDVSSVDTALPEMDDYNKALDTCFTEMERCGLPKTTSRW